MCRSKWIYAESGQSPAELLRAIREVYDGGAPMSGLIARKVVSVFQVNDSGGWGWNPLHAKKGKALPVLSNRENEILQQLARASYTKKSLQIFSSVRKRSANMYTIFMKNCMSATGWKPSINISEEHEYPNPAYHFNSSLLLFRFTSAIRWEASISMSLRSVSLWFTSNSYVELVHFQGS